jgi:GAF domain-containing protein
MEFIPETLEALGELDTYLDEGTLADSLWRSAEQARRLAPDLAGVSVGSRAHGLTFTLVATAAEIAALDAVQYLDGGPGVEVFDAGRGLSTSSEDLLSEPRWRALGQASAATGVRSTLTFPILVDGEVTGTVNLYGRSDDTFHDKHAVLASVFEGWAPGAVTNADLSFSSRLLAEQAPAQLRDEAVVDAATGILAAAHDLPVEAARAQLHDAAARASVPLTTLARMVVGLHEGTG